eukprot:TRINITY_DN21601_c0_g1_i1.p1 TRINITY_DN21601_c0_g1~~TRINITY_DN21601_c0_g1_i1.p1  ORF type:complete len:1679 (-),score=285.60 TRINITY_DN21601_c0_g1_i1:47-4669(-)
MTDGAKNRALRLGLGDADIGFLVRIQVYRQGNANDFVEFVFNPRNIAVTHTSGVTTLDIPFSEFQLPPFNAATGTRVPVTTAENGYIFTDVGMIVFVFESDADSDATVDLSLDKIETVPTVTVSKAGTVVDIDTDRDLTIANPGDLVHYVITVENLPDILALEVSDVLIFDPQAVPGFPNNLYDIVPGTVEISYAGNPVVDPEGQPPAVIRTSDTDAFIVGYAEYLLDGQTLVLEYDAVLKPLPCCIPKCNHNDNTGIGNVVLPPCQSEQQKALADAAGEECHCVSNQARGCVNVDAATVTQIVQTGVLNIDCVVSDDLSTPIASPDATFNPIWARPDPQITIARKDGATGAVLPGSTSEFDIVVANTADRDSSPQEVWVRIPGQTTPANPSGEGWTCDAANCHQTIGALAAGATQPLAFSLTLASSLACEFDGFKVDTQVRQDDVATTCTCRDFDLTNNVDNVTVPVAGAPSLSVEKTVAVPSSGAALPGSEVTFKFAVRNNGQRPAEGVTLTDTLPAASLATPIVENGWNCPGNGQCTYTFPSAINNDNIAVEHTLRFIVGTDFDCDVTSFTNAVEVSNDCGGEPASDTADVDIGGLPNLALTKTDSNAVISSSSREVTYTFSVVNNGQREATNVVITDTLPASVSVSAGQSAWTPLNGDMVTSVGDIAPGASASATLVVTYTGNFACDDVEIINTAVVSNDCGESDDSDDSASEITPIIGTPDIAIEKTATTLNGAGAFVTPSEVITYTLTYTNVGTREATGVVIKEKLPAGFTLESAGWTCPAGDCERTIGNVAIGASDSVEFAIRLPGTAVCNPADIVNEVEISETCGEENFNNNKAGTSTPVRSFVDLRVTKTERDTPVNVPGTTIISTISYENVGNADAENAVVTVTIPVHFTFNEAESSTDVWNCDATECKTAAATIPGNSPNFKSALIAFDVKDTVTCEEFDSSCTVSITSDCDDANEDDNSVTHPLTLAAIPVLQITKTDSDAEFTQGSSVTYTIEFENVGYRGLKDYKLVDTIPEQTTLNSALSPAEWDCTGRVCEFLYSGELAARSGVQTQTITLTIVDPLPVGVDEVTNTVSIQGNFAECGGVEKTATEPTPIIGNPDLTITKTDNDASVLPGEVIVYSITFENIGERDTSGVVIEEIVPRYTTFNAAQSTAGWVCGAETALSVCKFTYVGNNGVLNINAPQTILFAVTVDECVQCPVVETENKVSISDNGLAGLEIRSDNNDAADKTPINGLPSLFVTVDDGIVFAPENAKRPGERYCYTITWGHILAESVREATNVVLSTKVPDYTVYVRDGSSGWTCADEAAGAACSMNLGKSKAGDETDDKFFCVEVVRPFPVGITQTSIEVQLTQDCVEIQTHTDNHPTPLIGQPDLIVQKHARCAQYQWDITYSNIGTQVAREVMVTAHVPLDSEFNASASHAGWVCPSVTSGTECHLTVGDLEVASDGTAAFVVDTLPTSHITEIMHMSSIHAWVGDDADPTPDNNRDTSVIASAGCAACDSCCPELDECCPDQTSVAFNFQGVLEGLHQ